MKKIIILFLIFIFLTSCVSCSFYSSSKDALKYDKKTKIRVLNANLSFRDQIEKIKNNYEQFNSNVELEIENIKPENFRKVFNERNKNNQIDLFTLSGYDDMKIYMNKLENLTDQKWTKEIIEGCVDTISQDEKIFGQPQYIEGMGFIYNVEIFEKAGIKKLPKTLSEFELACKKLQKKGIIPISYDLNDQNSLEKNYLSIMLSQQPSTEEFIDGLMDGSIKLSQNKIAQDWVKFIDTIRKYSQKQNEKSNYSVSIKDFASGKSAIIQQGTWSIKDILKENSKIKAGFMPITINENKENSKVYMGVPYFWCVNKDSKLKEQTKELLEWIVSSKQSERFVYEKTDYIPAFKSANISNLSQLNKSFIDCSKNNNMALCQLSKISIDKREVIGNILKKYSTGKIEKDFMFKEIEMYLNKNISIIKQ